MPALIDYPVYFVLSAHSGKGKSNSHTVYSIKYYDTEGLTIEEEQDAAESDHNTFGQ